MTKITNKYKISFLLAIIVYLNFYFLSPLFHYHDQFEHYDSIGKEEHHLHFVNGQHEHENESHDDHHSMEDFSDHDLLTRINSTKLDIEKRIISFTVTCLFVEHTSDDNNQNYSNRLIETQPENYLQRERCVQTAANVSPPLV